MIEKNDVQLITNELIQEVLDQASSSDRLRTNYNFHSSMEENPHRFLNVMLKNTYIRPHRHLTEPKSESFIILEGRAAFFIFNHDGTCKDCVILDSTRKADALGIDIAPGVWHTLHVLSEKVVCFEVKPGPYVESSDKEFAKWSPEEGSDECWKYQEVLQDWVDDLD